MPAPVVGRPPGLCLPSLRLDPSGSNQGPAIPGSGAYSGGSLLGSTPLVPGPAGASGGDSLLPRRKDLLKQPHFHHYHQNLPVLQLTVYRLASDPHVLSDSLRQWLVSLPTTVADLPEFIIRRSDGLPVVVLWPWPFGLPSYGCEGG